MRKFNTLLLAALTLCPGCSLPSASTTLEADGFSLTASSPVAAFELKLCIDGPKVDNLTSFAQIEARATYTGGADAPLSIENLDGVGEHAELVPPAGNATRAAQPPLQLYLSTADNSPLQVKSGMRCLAPQVIQFDTVGLRPGQRIDIEWSVFFDVSYDDGLVGGSSLANDDLMIQIERL